MQQIPQRHVVHDHSHGVDEFSRRYKALLHAADIAARRGFPEFLQELSLLLHELFDFNFLNYALRHGPTDVMRVYMLDDALSPPRSPLEFSIEESPAGWTWSHQQPLVIPDLHLEKRFRPVLDLDTSKGIRSLMVLPMTTARRRLGTLSFGSAQVLHCDVEIVHFLERLASLVALALENSLFLEVSRLSEASAGEEKQIQDLATALLEL
jgi:formate hydrogenlyase transcriptional activator